MTKIYQKLLLTLLGLSLMLGTAEAQNSDYKWGVQTGFFWLDYATPSGEDYNINILKPGYNLGVIRNLNKSFNARLSFYIGEGDANATYLSNRSRLYNSLDIDLVGEYKFTNDYILPENYWLEPYLFAGLGYSFSNDNGSALVTGGAGLNFWVMPAAAIYVQTAYDSPLDDFYDPYMQHSVGLRFRIGAGNDRDGDGISDEKDACPDKPGSRKNNGCPDTDGDGLTDNVDECPEVAGLQEFQGCPDKDEDGVPDKDDNCPDTKGKKELSGCPDSDDDGIADKDDECPNEKGTEANKGCPDSDGDGIVDKDDDCPNEKGSSEFNGCPDSDGDGIMDKEDECPNEKGTKANNGCPEEIDEEKEKEIEKELQVDSEMINFETGKAKITKDSETSLDKIVKIMKEYPSAKFRVEGHTDNVGNAANNKKLSQARADAVKKYFTDKGVEASRVRSIGYGQEKPVANNGTAQGRAKNRRVEIHLDK